MTVNNLYPLHFSVYIGRPEISIIFLEAGADINRLDPTHHWAPIHYATYLNDAAYIRLLHSKGANIDQKGSYGETALHIAITNNHLECAKILIELGADVNLMNNKVFFIFILFL